MPRAAYALLLALLFSSAAHAQAIRGFPLLCKGLDTRWVQLGGGWSFEGSFRRAARAAGPRGEALSRGECAWVDRAMFANEPAHFSLPRTSDVLLTYDMAAQRVSMSSALSSRLSSGQVVVLAVDQPRIGSSNFIINGDPSVLTVAISLPAGKASPVNPDTVRNLDAEIRMNIKIPGRQYAAVRVPYPVDCVRRCESDGRCRAIMYQQAHKIGDPTDCSLLDSVAPGVSSPGTNSWTKR
jgi:hypothetical protein